MSCRRRMCRVVFVLLFFVTVCGPGDAGAQADHEPENAQFTIALPSKWSLVSVPVEVPDASLNALFPDGISAFRFLGGYAQADSLPPCVGFFLNLSTGGTYTIEGVAQGSCTHTLPSRWSLIGVPYGGTWAGAMESVPAGNVVSVFGFEASEGLFPVHEMAEGRAYWVNLAAAGDLTLTGVGTEPDPLVMGWAVGLTVTESGQTPKMVRFGISERGTDEVDTRLGEEDLALSAASAFDARFVTPGGSELTMDLRSNGDTEYIYTLDIQRSGPVTVSWDPDQLPVGVQFTLQGLDALGPVVDVDMRSQGSVQIDPAVVSVRLIARILGWMVELAIAEDGVPPRALYFGLSGSATDGLDPDVGEVEIAPMGPSGTFDARFLTPSSVGLSVDRRSSGVAQQCFSLNLQRINASGPVTVSWDHLSLPLGVDFQMTDIAGGFFGVNVDMRTQGSVTFSNSFLTMLQICVTAQDAPVLSVSPDSLLFSTTLVDSSTLLPLLVSNTGLSDLVVSEVSVTGADASEFAVSPTVFTIPSGGDTTLTVVFTPGSLEEKFASLSIAHNAVGSPTTVSLRGNGVLPAPCLEIVPSPIPTLVAAVGDSVDQVLTISNPCTADLVITGFLISGLNASSFQVLPSGPVTIASGDSAQVTVRFSPVSAGSKTASLGLAHNAAGNLTTLPLQGNTPVTGFQVSGTVSYFAGGRVVPDARLVLSGDSTLTVDSASDGGYAFGGLAAGTYTVTPSKTTDFGGMNATDALDVVRHTAGLTTFPDPNQLLAGDVNENGDVNATDGLVIVRATAGVAPLPLPDWAFVPQSRSYAPLDGSALSQNYVAVRRGDVNGSWMPDGVVLKPAVEGGDLRVRIPDLTAVAGRETTALLRAAGDREVGAVTLFVSYPSEALVFEGLDGVFEGFEPVVGHEPGVVRVVWADLTGRTPVRLPELGLRFRALEGEGDAGAIRFLNGTELADGNGEVIPAAFVGGRVRVVDAPEAYALYPNVPNPFNPATQIAYDLPEAGEVSLVVYALSGQQVRRLVRGFQEAGAYRVQWDGTDDEGRRVASGIYLYRLKSGTFLQTRRMLLLK